MTYVETNFAVIDVLSGSDAVAVAAGPFTNKTGTKYLLVAGVT